MVKHIILWNLKDEFNTKEIKDGIKTGLENLKGEIPGLLEIKVIINPLETSNADVMLYSVFEDNDSLKGYAVHPKHVYAADTFVRPFTKSRSCMDYED
ncbi:MAG: Dabb family protein [Clostridia bacterium]|nr:Dabb family protein [Clostridia bacterium]